jgi:hypothetical protein
MWFSIMVLANTRAGAGQAPMGQRPEGACSFIAYFLICMYEPGFFRQY